MPTRLWHLDDVQAVIFDVYGTLFVSKSGDIGTERTEDDEWAFRQALAHILAEPRFRNDFAGSVLIRQRIFAAHAQARRHGIEYPEVDIVEIWKEVLSMLPGVSTQLESMTPATLMSIAVEYECRINPVWPMPGLLETINTLHEANIRLGIVSNAQFYTPLLFPALLGVSLEDLGFEPELCSWSYQILEAKPSERLFRRVSESLKEQYNIIPAQTLYVGNDVLKDIDPAQQLGCRTALFAGDKRSLRLHEADSRCSHVKPELVIGELPQLIRALNA